MATRSRRTSRDTTAWLSSDQIEAWKAISHLVNRLPTAMDVQLRRDSGLRYIEYYVLAGLSDAPERTMRVSELAMLTNAELSRLSHLLTRMEKRGLVRREPDPDDGRFTNAVLTEEGYTCLVDAAPGHVRLVRKLVIDALGDNALRDLRDAATVIVDSIDENE